MAILANGENDALVNALVDWLADVVVEKLGEEKANKEADAQVGTLAENITECESTHLATYCWWWRLTRNRDTSVQAKAGRGQHTWPNIRRGEDLVFGQHIN